MLDEDHGYMLADQDVGIQYSERVLDSVEDRNIFKVLTLLDCTLFIHDTLETSEQRKSCLN